MNNQNRVFYYSDGTTHDALAKQSIIDAENKLNVFKETTNISITGLESYLKYMVRLEIPPSKPILIMNE